MKIKTKKQLNLPQLIEWAMDNEIKDRKFLTDNYYRVGFDRHGFIYFNSVSTMPLDETFTVEVEEEITEDTVIPKMLLVYESEDSHFVEGRSFKGLSKSCVKAIYILNDDHTMTLIWCDGKLVE